MRQIFIVIFFLAISPIAFAQSYSEYLTATKKHLKNGNKEMARTTYNIYKELSGKKDPYVESQLNPSKTQNPSKSSAAKAPAKKANNVKTPAKQASKSQGKLSTQTFTVNGVSFQMVHVQGGTFRMGSNDSDAYDDEKPVHSVTLSDYYIGETEVTQQLWYAVMGNNPSYFTGNSQRPVEQVSWDDCQTFIRKLNALTGKKFRLPTEAEWEYAARGGNRSRGFKYSGSNSLSEVAWYDVNSYDKGSSHPDYGTHPVKQKSSNELGLYDMSGNVWEWCQDWFDSQYYSKSPSYNPTGPTTGSRRVYRGGGWISYARYCRVAFRCSYSPDFRRNRLGLRLAL